MAGIEDAFEKFVTRVSNKERSPEEIPLDKYTPYTEQEILGNLESKYPNYSPPEYDSYETMPIYPPRDVIPKGAVPVMPEIMNRDRQYMDLADGGLSNLIKNNIGPEYRLYTRTMVPGLKTGKLDENYFPDDFKLDLRKQALEKYSRTGDLSGQVNEKDQHLTRSSRQNAITKFPSTYATLGTYSYEIDPKTLDVKVKDKYDWNPAYGTQGNFTGWIGNDNPKARDVDTSLIKDYISNSFKNKRVDTSAGLEMLGNLLGPRASKGEGVDIDINIPTEFSAMRADTPYAEGGVASMFRERPEYSLGGPTKAIRKIGEPTQQESAAGLVFNPGPYEGPYEGPYILGGPRPGQYYQSSPITSITGPDGAIPRPGMPMMSSPSTQTSQTDVSTNSIAKALEMAGFTREEIMRILGQQGFADGGRVSMSDGGLTKTVPPAKGPDSQGVESLFRRRYS